MRPTPLALILLLAAATASAQDATDNTAMAADAGATVAMSQDAAEAMTDDVVAEETDLMRPRDATTVTLDEFLWVARPIVVFADTPADPRFIEQMELLAERPGPLLERDVVILFDTDPSARSAVRTQLRPRGFGIVVMAKDGSVGLRRPSPRDVREIIHAIDNFSLRQEEMMRGG